MEDLFDDLLSVSTVPAPAVPAAEVKKKPFVAVTALVVMVLLMIVLLHRLRRSVPPRRLPEAPKAPKAAASAAVVKSDFESLTSMYMSQGLSAEDAMFFANARTPQPALAPVVKPVSPVDDVIIVTGPVPHTPDEEDQPDDRVTEDDPRILSMLASRKDFTN